MGRVHFFILIFELKMNMNLTGTKVLFITTIALLVMSASCVVYYDPYFHYHAPIEKWEYKLYDERYQNDGILSHFSYDSVIIGTSMTRNFKASDWNNLMNANTVKAPFSGATYKEIGDVLKRILPKKRHQICYTVFGLFGT